MNRVFKKRSFLTTVVTLLLVVCLTGCFSSDFDAKRYTQGCLDALTKAKFDDYTEMTTITKEEAQKQYDEHMDKELASLTGAVSLSADLQEQYLALFKDLYSKCKYEVGEAVKNSDESYTVTVTTYKMKAFEGAMESVMKKVEELAKESKNISQDEVTEKTFQFLLDEVKGKLENVEYAEAQKIDISVTCNNSTNTYTISESDYQKIVQACIDIDALSNQ